jgi:UDP-N-acetylmuramoylalanine--D-glutamate ligase
VGELKALLRDPSGRRVVVAGAGRQGLSAARLLAALGADVLVCDDAPLEKLQRQAAGLAGIKLRSGFAEDVLQGASFVVLSAGLPRRHAAIQRALVLGLPVVNEVEVGAAQLPATVFVGITGTNGKSTTTTLLGSIFAAFEPSSFAGGNLGVPLCEAVLAGARPRLAVLELSSYQLETITCLPLRAAIATNLAPDHLDRYDSLEAYYAAKARILKLVTERGASCLNRGDPHSRRFLVSDRVGRAFDFDVLADGDGVVVEGSTLLVHTSGAVERLELTNPRLVGRHNALNAAAAVAAAAVVGVPPSAWREGLATWGGIEHRLERLGEAEGVSWFNDSKATNVDAAVTGVKSFERGVHLIAGGVGKGSSYAPLAEAARGRVKALYTIGEDGPAIGAAFAGVCEVIAAGTLEVAVRLITERAGEGEVLLLSPACASFDQFSDFRARGDALRALLAAQGEKA